MTDGQYEKETIDFLKDFLKTKNNGLFFDIGSHNGLISLPLAKELAPDSNIMVFAFEPFKYIFERLKINIYANGLDGIIRPYNLGCGEKKCKKKLYIPKTENKFINYGVSSTDKSMTLRTYKDLESVEIDIVSLDEWFFDKEDIKEKNIYACKIDVEGNELCVLNGMKKILELKSPALIIEYNISNFKQLNNFLDFYGYKFVGSLQRFGISKELTEKNLLYIKMD
ncbi:FkbM family methyltransferase [Prochlorococcus marinus]|uniref:FkbM family methyltransferase n=1 Tax=Prochlorococcus marinus TaxID=1219 RepID=UPI0039AF2F55